MNVFGIKLSKVDSHLDNNIRLTKKVFPEETKAMEFGLALMFRLNDIINEALTIYKNKPEIVANSNLFGRNRQLLLNAYFCLICASYGSCFVKRKFK